MTLRRNRTDPIITGFTGAFTANLAVRTRAHAELDHGSVEFDDHGKPRYLGAGLLISWSELDYVEFVEV